MLFGLVLIVYAKIMPKSGSGKGQESNMLGEIEQTMDHFAAELDEQNKALIQMFGETKKEYELNATKLLTRIEGLESQNNQLRHEMNRLGVVQEQWQTRRTMASPLSISGTVTDSRENLAENANQASRLQEEAQASSSPQPPSFAMNMRERYKELFQLHEQGKSTDHIAKKLGMNKGEINLIVQLARQEERAHDE
ncbi:DUF6115 domain-containing protein [Paenibacillus cremeus]|uniref:DUF6115 domain-containing protein n=1 Tax=Paenibacillus cremeus TaxID=2163881 RepID=UPI0021BD4197|nr:hypothetical protein [Paenibacillus cremeus]